MGEVSHSQKKTLPSVWSRRVSEGWHTENSRWTQHSGVLGTGPPVPRGERYYARGSATPPLWVASLTAVALYVTVPGPCDPEDLIDGIIFAANYLGSTQLLSDKTPSKNVRMMQAQEAVSRIKVRGRVCSMAVAGGAGHPSRPSWSPHTSRIQSWI